MNELIVLFRPYPVGALLKKLSEDRDSFNLSEMRAPCRFMNGGRRRRSGLLVQVRALPFNYDSFRSCEFVVITFM